MATAKMRNLGIPRLKHKRDPWHAIAKQISLETEALSAKPAGAYWLSDSLAPEEHV